LKIQHQRAAKRIRVPHRGSSQAKKARQAKQSSVRFRLEVGQSPKIKMFAESAEPQTPTT
jgi:hypothetical protein